MRFHRESRDDRYDVVVVGAGFGGLAGAALLAHAGRRVLLVERHDRPGGYGHAFRRGRYRFDSAVHLVGGVGKGAPSEGGLPARLLAALGLEGRVPLVPIDPVYTAVLGARTVRAPAGLDAFLEAMTREFPRERKGLRELLAECVAIRGESERADQLELSAGPRVLERFPSLVRYRRATLASVLEAHVGDPTARAALAALWPYLGLPPARVSFLYFATMLLSYVADGSFYCRGTFQQLANALARSVEEAGGEVLLRSQVRRIEVRDGRVDGVVLENGQRIAAATVVSGADLSQTVFDLVGAEHFSARWVGRLRRLEPSVSAFVVYGATRCDLAAAGLSHETFFYPGADHEEAWRSSLTSDPSWLSITVPTLADPSLAPSGEHLFTLTTLVPYEPAERWRHAKSGLQERLLARADARIPGLRAGLTFCEAGTPRTMERYTRNTGGALYGHALSPAQVGPGRPGAETPLPGLYLAGHWTRPGGGVYGVLASGAEAARRILDLPTREALFARVGAARGQAPRP